jgi:hypothetical protein
MFALMGLNGFARRKAIAKMILHRKLADEFLQRSYPLALNKKVLSV